MGRSVLGLALATVCTVGALFFVAKPAQAQVPVPAQPAPAESPPGAVAPPPAPAAPPPVAPPPVAPPPVAPPPVAPPPVAPPPASPAAPAAEPPLDLPPQEVKRPAFLHTREEMEKLEPGRRAHPRTSEDDEPSNPHPAKPKQSLHDFIASSSPWIDFSLTSFYMEDRVSNFLNFGVQVGGYVLDRLRISARLITPIEAIDDDYTHYGVADGTGSTRVVKSRSASLLYGASVGFVVTNSKTFVFGPSVAILRTDVEDYGSAIELAAPFEWTTKRNLRVGFEFGIGYAFDGSARQQCTSNVSGSAASCGSSRIARDGGTLVLLQYYMGWSLGTL